MNWFKMPRGPTNFGGIPTTNSAKNFGIRSYGVIPVGITVSGHVTRRFSASLTVLRVTHCRAVNFAIGSNDCHRHPREAPHPPGT